MYVFFFQAEDGIRDGRVTGVQTCALPISSGDASADGPRVRSVSLHLMQRMGWMMDLGMQGKVAVVTGAGRGIGLAVVRALVDEGVSVVAGTRSPDRKSVV